MDKKFLIDYFTDYQKLIDLGPELINQLIESKNVILQAKANDHKVIIIGNGGSAAIASHVSVDLTKNAHVPCINFNEPDLITCFANDYGYENWVGKALEFYGKRGNVLICISSSGQSKNILNGCLTAREMKFSKVITFSGFQPDNSLRQMGDINFWVDSKAYNLVENTHQFWLSALVDMIIGKAEYSADEF